MDVRVVGVTHTIDNHGNSEYPIFPGRCRQSGKESESRVVLFVCPSIQHPFSIPEDFIFIQINIRTSNGLRISMLVNL